MTELHDSGRRRWPAWPRLVAMSCLAENPRMVRGFLAMHGPQQPATKALVGNRGAVLALVAMGLLVAAMPQGDRERGLALYAQGQYVAAANAFRAALQSEGDSPELQYNLALACWRAGELEEAELAAEKYAASARQPRPELHRGLLGAVRHAQALALQETAQMVLSGQQGPGAQQGPTGQLAPHPQVGPDPQPGPNPLQTLQEALAKAEQARDYFVRGAIDGNSAELRRNTERTLRLIEELKRQIEELKQQSQPSPDDSKDNKDNKDQQDQQDQQDKQDEKNKQDDKSEPREDDQKSDKKGEPKSDEKSDPSQAQKSEQEQGKQDPSSQSGEQPPKPPEEPGKPPSEPQPPEPQPQQAPDQPSESKEGESKEGESKELPKPAPNDPEPPADAGKEPAGDAGGEPQPPQNASPRQDAPGEQRPGRELTQEQEQRLLEALRDGEQKLRELRQRANRAARRAAEQDW